MFCSQCGQELSDDVKFCNNCGFNLSGSGKKAVSAPDDGRPLLVLKPRIVGWEPAFAALPIAIFLMLWGGGILGMFAVPFLDFIGLSLPVWLPFVVFFILFLVGIPFLAYKLKKKTYEKTEYRFFRNHLEYEEGFWAVENKSLKYANITKTAMRKGVIQKRYGLGTIFLACPAAGTGVGTEAMSGIKIKDVENPDQVYEMVQKLLGC